MTRDKGITPRSKWQHDDTLVDLAHKAVLSLRDKNAFGPRRRSESLAFRTSEIGDIISFRDHKGDPGGCARKPFYSFWAEHHRRRPWSADELLNFGRGDDEEARVRDYLEEAGILEEEQVKLGAWGDQDAPEYFRGDPRYPDRSGGLIRGKCDFVIRHPEHGVIPLEWKTCSTYIFGMLKRSGPKGDNALQAQFYAHEMGTDHVALGYINKETGQLAIFTAPTDRLLIRRVLDRATKLKADILAGKKPPMPEGLHPPEDVYDRVWPCYVYAPKKRKVMACAFYEACHGMLPDFALKAMEGGAPAPKRKPRGKKTSGKTISFKGSGKK